MSGVTNTSSRRYPAVDLQQQVAATNAIVAGWWDCILRWLAVLWIVRVPLAMTAFGFALLGLTSQAQDLFVEFARTGWGRMLWFLAVLVVVWAMPTHYAARLLIDTDRRFRLSLVVVPGGNEHCSQLAALWIPRLLGLSTFAAVLMAILRSRLNLPDLPGSDTTAAVDRALIEMAALVIAGAIAFFCYAIWRPHNAEWPLIRWLKPVNRWLAPLWRTLSPGLRQRDPDDEISQDVGRFWLVLLFGLFAAVFIFGADRVAVAFPRAFAVPFILGGWLPFLSYLAAVGRQIRAPLIIGWFFAIAIIAVIFGDNHSVRMIDAAAHAGQAVATKSVSLNDALADWKKANGCETKGPCPRPIIVTAAGGASRAGFFMASVVGFFLESKEAAERGLNPDIVRNRLFAISGISGGSVGAVMVTKALSENTDSRHNPCTASSAPEWWPANGRVSNWRDCVEALTSGDFLTADFLGFAFNDMLPLAFFRDRAAVLEDTWKEHYATMVASGNDPHKCNMGLECPFYTLRPSSDHWIPLLLLNGTSEATGGRIITTLLSFDYSPAAPCPGDTKNNKCRIFAQTDRFHDLLTEQVPKPGWPGGLGRLWLRYMQGEFDDVRLSTAAHNSARFPFISPPGTVRNGDESVVDRIVDGGYVENYGALSGKELALALHAIDGALVPLVVVISNDPDDLLTSPDVQSASTKTVDPQKQQQRARALVSGSELVTDLMATLNTVSNARTSHGLLGVDELDNSLQAMMPDKCTAVIDVRVWPQPEEADSDKSKAVSMSWWLSAPVQEYLNRQGGVQVNRKQGPDNNAQLTGILDQIAAPSPCTMASK
jgi:hypothetical protein